MCTYIPTSRYDVPARCYKKYRDIEFETHTFMCFDDYNSYLKYAYGEKYMELPHKSKRKPHVNIYEFNFESIFGGKF